MTDNILLDTNQYKITNMGMVIAKYELLLDLIKNKKNFKVLSEYHDDIELYNRRNPEISIPIWDGKDIKLDDNTYKFNIPEKYVNLNITEYVIEKIEERFNDIPLVYLERIELELCMMYERHMEDFIRCLIYIRDIFIANNVVYGIGRGSACASLVLFIIGLHKVDPIKYDININEFLR